MAILGHVQSFWAKDIVAFGRISRLDAAGADSLVVRDPARGAVVTIGLEQGLIGREDISGTRVSDRRALKIGGADRSLDAGTLSDLRAGPGATSAYLDGPAYEGNRAALASVRAHGDNWLIAAQASKSGIAAYRLTASGALPFSSALADTEGRALSGVGALSSVVSGGKTYVLAASTLDNGIAALRLDAGGTLVHTHSLTAAADELPVHRPTAVAGITTEAGAFALLASAGTGSLTTLKLSSTGRLSFVDQLADTRDSRFDAVSAMDWIRFGERVLVAVAGGDGGVSLVEMLPDGRLMLRDTFIDTMATALRNVADLEFTLNGAMPELWALGTDDGAGEGAGLTRLRLYLGPDGAKGASGTGTKGTSAPDTLIAPAGGVTVEGGGGDDILADGTGADVLRGGAGADTFVFAPDGQEDRIGLFDVSEDRIDLSAYPGVHSAADLRVSTYWQGARLHVGEDSILVISEDRKKIAAADLLDTVDFGGSRVYMPDSAAWLVIKGTSGADGLFGAGGAETISGWGGSDWITPGPGSDSVDGGAGSDMVSFYDHEAPVAVNLSKGEALSGPDTNLLTSIENVTGTIYADYIEGDGGANKLRGLGHYDWFVGSWGADSYDGGSGRDMISYVRSTYPVTVDLGAGTGSAGQAKGDVYTSIERVTGSIHPDLLIGSEGEDEMRGLGGYDWFVGSGGGRDRYDGGSGKDTVAYTASPAGVTASLLLGRGSAGDAARDLYTAVENLTGSNHADILTGDNGRNVLRGMWGPDRLLGNGGVDRITGGGSDDIIDGGSGWDYALYAHDRADYTVTRLGTATTVRYDAGGGEGLDTLYNIEVLSFADGNLYL